MQLRKVLCDMVVKARLGQCGAKEKQKVVILNIRHHILRPVFWGGWWFDANLYVLKYCQKKTHPKTRAHFAPTKDRAVLGSRHRPRK